MYFVGPDVMAELFPISTGIFGELIEELFLNLKSKIKDEGLSNIPEKDCIELRSIFEDIFDSALSICDDSKIIFYRNEANTSLIAEIINRTEQRSYRLFPNLNYCSCLSFRCHVVMSQKHYTCKHVLAVKLADLLNIFELKIISEEELHKLRKLIII